MERDIIEIPQVDIPDEVTHTNSPEIIETTPHPQTPDPQVREGFAAERAAHVGFITEEAP